MDFFSTIEENEELKKVGIGTSVDYQIQKELREKLGMYCFISLSGSEFHLAKYPVGSRYKKHIDQFNKQSNRQITVLIYLNKDWKSEEGGFLIEPIAKRMLLFNK